MLMDVNKLLKEYNLKIGDRIVFTEDVEWGQPISIYSITRLSEGVICLTKDTNRYCIDRLFNEEWEQYDPNNYVGMKSCSDFTNCEGCPLNGLRCQDLKGKNLNAKWEAYKKKYSIENLYEYNISNALEKYCIKK